MIDRNKRTGFAVADAKQCTLMVPFTPNSQGLGTHALPARVRKTKLHEYYSACGNHKLQTMKRQAKKIYIFSRLSPYGDRAKPSRP